jgi:hypothetical protein
MLAQFQTIAARAVSMRIRRKFASVMVDASVCQRRWVRVG